MKFAQVAETEIGHRLSRRYRTNWKNMEWKF